MFIIFLYNSREEIDCFLQEQEVGALFDVLSGQLKKFEMM